MDTVPVKNGKRCIFRVVRVSGTIRKAEEEAIRRAREMILRARRELGEQGDKTLDAILGKSKMEQDKMEDGDIRMVDRSDSEEEEEERSDGDG
jgi:ribonuclease P/MRP protein subunit POP5